MRKTLIITGFLFFLFLIEFFLFNIFGKWFTPNLLLIFVVFVNLYFGIRPSLMVACGAGILKDAFSLDVFGTHIFSFMVCACLTTYIRRNFYQPGSRLSRVFVVFVTCCAYILLVSILKSIKMDMDFFVVFNCVFIPQTAVTLVVTTFVIAQLKQKADQLRL